jgi:hypothetical protein
MGENEQLRRLFPWHGPFRVIRKSRSPPRQEQPCYTKERRVILKRDSI